MPAEIRISINQQTSGAGVANAKRDLSDLSDTAARSGGGFNSLREVATGALRQVGAMATQAFLEAGRAAIGFFKDSISMAGNFEAGMNAVGAALGEGFEPGTAALDEFHDLFIDLGKKLPVSTSEVQAAALAMAKGGLEPATIAAGALESTLNFAAAAGMGLEKAAELTIKQLGTFVPIGASVTEQTEFMATAQNLLVKAAGASTLNVDKLGDAMLAAGGAAKASGVDYEDFVTTMGLISPSFGNAAEAGTQFKNFVSLLVPSTEKAKDMMGALGLTTEDGSSKFYDAQGNFLGLRNAAELLQESFKGLSDAERAEAMKTLFGNDAKDAAIALMSAGAEGYDAFVAKMEAANGVTEQAAAVQQGFNFAMENIKGTVEALQIQIGEYLLPYLTTLVTTANGVINAITGDKAAFDALSPTLQAIIVTVQQLWVDLQAGVAFVQGVMASFSAVGGQSALLETAISSLSGIWQHIQTVIATVAPYIQAVVMAVFGQIQTFLNAHGADIMAFIQKTWNAITEIIHLALNLIVAVLVPILTGIAGYITAHGAEIQTILTAIWEGIKAIIDGALILVKGIITAALQLINGDFSGAWETIKTMSAAFVESLITLFTSAWEILKTIFGTSVDKILSDARIGLAAIGAAITTWFTTQKTNVTTGLAAILKIFTDYFTTQKTNVTTGLAAIGTAITTFFTTQKTNFTNGLAAIKLIWDTMWALLKSTFEALLNSIVGWVVQTMTGIGNAIKAAAGGIASSAAGVGAGIVSGIIDGIKNGVGAIISAAKSAAKAALDAAMDALGVGSPSKVFAAQVGLPIAQGMAVGMMGGAPLVARAAEQTANAAVGAGRQATYNQQRSVTYAPVYNNTASASPEMDQAFARSLAGGI